MKTVSVEDLTQMLRLIEMIKLTQMLLLKLGGEAIAIDALSLGSQPPKPRPGGPLKDHFLIIKVLR
jgi:hypothetical protein